MAIDSGCFGMISAYLIQSALIGDFDDNVVDDCDAGDEFDTPLLQPMWCWWQACLVFYMMMMMMTWYTIVMLMLILISSQRGAGSQSAWCSLLPCLLRRFNFRYGHLPEILV